MKPFCPQPIAGRVSRAMLVAVAAGVFIGTVVAMAAEKNGSPDAPERPSPNAAEPKRMPAIDVAVPFETATLALG